MPDNDLRDVLDAHDSWSRARQELFIQKVICVFRICSLDLIPFEEVRKHLHLAHYTHRGLQSIEISKIRGSVGRYQDFTNAFLPRKEHMRDRWMRVKRYVDSSGIPPIEVYKVGEVYFVVDGHHRVSVARQEGEKVIGAHVIEYSTNVELSPNADMNEVLLKAEYVEFMEKTRLEQLRPDHNLIFSSPGNYRLVEHFVVLLQERMALQTGEPVTFEIALSTWFERVYTPVCREIRDSGALEQFPGRTEADLFIWIWENEQDLSEEWIEGLFGSQEAEGEGTELARLQATLESLRKKEKRLR